MMNFAALKAVPGLYGSAFPLAAGIAGASALLAPHFLKSKDRGYTKTSLLTTPVLAGGLAAAPGLWKATHLSGRSLFHLAKNAPLSFSIANWKLKYTVAPDLQSMAENGHISREDFARWAPLAAQERRQSEFEYFQKLARTNEAVPVSQLQDAVGNLWQERIASLNGDQDKLHSFSQDMTFALYEAQLKSSTPGDLKSLPISYPSKVMSLEEIDAQIAQGKNFSEKRARDFYRNLKRRLTIANQHQVGPAIDPSLYQRHQAVLARGFRNDKATRGLITNAVGSSRGQQMLAHLQKAQEQGWLDSIDLMMEQDQAVGLRLSRGKKMLTFGFENQDSPKKVLVWMPCNKT
jgi:hypothetical protein